MMYCVNCRNMHWGPAGFKRLRDYVALLLLVRPYRCQKCNIIQSGFILNVDSSGRRRDRPQQNAEAKCPACGAHARRVRRSFVERLLVFFHAYECSACGIRFRIANRLNKKSA